MTDPAFQVDFLGIGPSKAGTTWVGHMLEAHPRICMAEPKEVHFFNDSLSFNQSYHTRHYALGLEWYQKHFKHCAAGTIRGEITPRYLIDPVVPQRIYDHNPQARLIVCLRAPFDRIVSHYHSARDYHHSEPRSLARAIREEPEYIEACMYFQNVSRFLPLFPMKQIFFVDMEQVATHPQQVVVDLYAFLGVQSDFVPDSLYTKSNPARTTRSLAFRKWTGSLHRKIVAMGFSPWILLLKKIGIGKLINRLNSGPILKAALSEEDKIYIRERIKEDVSQFSKLMERDFSHWLK